MSRLSANPFLILIFGLAALGFGYQLITNPLGLLTYLAVGAAVAVGMYFLFTKVILKRMAMSQYRQSARPGPSPKKPSFQNKNLNTKANKHKPQRSRQSPLKKRTSRPIAKKRTDHNLTVIEGKKNRKKNRALF
ncbi:hypothetical protein SAMN05192534_106131 [Alteribacillus persepolensis]|uniref:Uncharacterized protein n=1 Tax=Alteribacillus persepolensis TaxID=568899 RepID=A0A1G8CYE9_9BACI|nr:hypothetical protein SAMN05192534_106131 [Alteribacillus persepolensis]